MPLDSATYAQFKQLIDATGNKNEVECGRYLCHAAALLCPRTPRSVDRVIQEDRTYYGDSDCIVIADLANGRGKAEKYAVIWEVKAPQCPLMEFDGNSKRCIPSRDLLKAENQLMHYAFELQNNDAFRQRNGILSREHIILGGVIIGRDGKFASDQRSPDNERHAEASMDVRNQFFYNKAGFKVWTWDEIDSFLAPF